MTKQMIFFSYSRADGSEFALRLATDLKKKGFDVWIDQQDIRAGQEWDTEIEKALESCDCVLFVETEKSVVSNNVLDEVYYALENNKKVIPLIYVDSRTPFRINRLQHINFTKNYDTGLALLVNELERNTQTITYPPQESTPVAAHNKPFYKNYRALLVIAGLALVITFVVVFTANDKRGVSAETQGSIALTDTTSNNNGKFLPDTPVITDKEQEVRSKEVIVLKEDKRKDQGKKVAAGSVNANAESIETKTETNLTNLNEIVAGDWRLIDIEPKAASQGGYLKIEALGENKATIKTYMQFYYPDSKAASYLTIFNAFAGCTSCDVNKEMKLKVEDIAVGSRTIKKLQEDQADGRKAGDVILDANSNKSIRGTITLAFLDNNNAVIKVQQPNTIALANEFMLEPFVYTFHFKKTD
jgi:hypothetical protein